MRSVVKGFGVAFALFAVTSFAAAQTATPIVPDLTLTVTLPVDLTLTPDATGTPDASGTPDVTSEATMDMTSEATLAAATPAPTSDMSMTAEATLELDLDVTAEATASADLDPNAHFRVAHFSPDAPDVDVFVNGEAALEGVAFPGVSDWTTVAPDTYSVAVSAAGTSLGEAVLTQDVSLAAGTWQTVAAVGSADAGTLALVVITEDYREPLPGTGGITVVNAIVGSPSVNVIRDGIAFATELSPAEAAGAISFVSVLDDAGTFDFRFSETQDPANVYVDLPQQEIVENAYTLVAAVGTVDDPQGVVVETDRSIVEIEIGTLPEPGTIVEALLADENLTTLAALATSADLVETLSGDGEFTVFAPANFVLDVLRLDPSALPQILLEHVVEGKYTSLELQNIGTLTSLGGTTLTFTVQDNFLFVNNAQIITVNVAATNGVVHIVNEVIVASDSTGMMEMTAEATAGS